MEAYAAFKPASTTVAISAPTSTPATGIQLSGPSYGDITVYVYNPGPNLVWLGWGSTAAAAQTNAVAPVAGTPQYALPCGPGSYQTFTFSGLATYFSCLAVTSTQLIYLASGGGL